MDRTLVVGGAGGVGSAVAARLVGLGRRVVATVRTAEQAAELGHSIAGLEDVIVVDLADADTAKAVLSDWAADEALAGVINCAARSAYGPMETASLAAFREMLEINTVSSLAVFQACMPGLRAARGRILMVSSYSGKIALPFLGMYKASKFALEALADVMRMEAADFGVNVIVVQPGGIDTNMSHTMATNIARDVERLEAQSEPPLYAGLYHAFARILQSAATSPSGDDVAQAVLAAFDAEDPEPRYVYGSDAEWFLDQRKMLTDREMDALARQIYGLAPQMGRRLRL